ncbi:hypothetical protein [Amycolatopsis sp. cmx-4-68]|uniref:hypothetical protein n=1 Tax=Amycolatopsis sp. cmx-4-68 TaxID=2790938 RepID=UPI003978D55B
MLLRGSGGRQARQDRGHRGTHLIGHVGEHGVKLAGGGLAVLQDPVERVREHNGRRALGQLGEQFGHSPVLADANAQHPVPGVPVLGHKPQVNRLSGHR